MKAVPILICTLNLLIFAACRGPEMMPLPVASPVVAAQENPTQKPSQEITQEATLSMQPSDTPHPNTSQPNPESSSTPGLSGIVQSPFSPQPGDENLRRGPAFLDQAEVAVQESFPPKVSVHLAGNLPTPCNKLRVSASGPTLEKQIDLDVYSVIAADVICAQMLAPFEESIQLSSLPAGKYSVRVNGKDIGQFDMP
jgi:hypothetical protein